MPSLRLLLCALVAGWLLVACSEEPAPADGEEQDVTLEYSDGTPFDPETAAPGPNSGSEMSGFTADAMQPDPEAKTRARELEQRRDGTAPEEDEEEGADDAEVSEDEGEEAEA